MVSVKTQIGVAVLAVVLCILVLTVGHLLTQPWYEQHIVAAVVGGLISTASYRWRHRQ
jgi:hypothetical protein